MLPLLMVVVVVYMQRITAENELSLLMRYFNMHSATSTCAYIYIYILIYIYSTTLVGV